MKRIISTLLLIFSLGSSFAQGICDSVITMLAIEDVCPQPYNFVFLEASHPGGVFSGPNISEVGAINTQNLQAGTYTAVYTITTDDCVKTAEQTFIVLDQPDVYAFSTGTVDCNNPGANTVDLIGDYFGNGIYYWINNNEIISTELITTVTKAGRYYFHVEDFDIGNCETIVEVIVDQTVADPIAMTSCNDCGINNGRIQVGVENAPEGAPRRWTNLSNGYVYNWSPCLTAMTAGYYKVEVEHPTSGCISQAYGDIQGVFKHMPSCSAGSTSAIACAGGLGQLLGVYNETEWEFEVEWTTMDGNLVSGENTLTPYFDAPGEYFLKVTNPLTGCYDIDSTTVFEVPFSTFVEQTICAGESYNGFTETGNYVDTLQSIFGCDSIIILDLLVDNDINVTSSAVDDDGAGNGAVVLDVLGEGPFYFDWSNNVSGLDPYQSGLSEGSYEVTITSINNCSLVYSFEIGLDSEAGGASTELNGVAFFDLNENCLLDEGELPLSGVHVTVANEQIFAQNTNPIGIYKFPLKTGDYVLTATPPSPLWEPCNDSIAVSLPNDFDVLTVNYPFKPLISSPVLNVEIATPFLRRCFENTYTISYENNGSITATDAYVEIHFDDELEFISSTIDWINLGENTYSFELGDIPVGGTGSFKVIVKPDCTSTMLGDILCVEAHIYPDTIPELSPMNWEGALITVDGECIDGELQFNIRNVGQGNMQNTNDFIVIEDAILNKAGEFNLNSGEVQTETIEGNGATFLLRAEQVEGAPADPFPGYAIEGCADGMSSGFSTGYLNSFPFSDLGDPVDTDCQQVVGSYDPNQKTAYPSGYTDANYIERGVPIEYMIEFQNTGTDTAFKVEIVDELSEHLDLSTFELLNSSHPQSYRIVPNQKVTFTFDPIFLPDSTTNEIASHGFVKFKIYPHPDLPAGTVIENKAGIYFDFNEPIITNQTKHTIWEQSVFDFFTSINYVEESGIAMQIFPNPFSKTATIELEGDLDKTVIFTLYDLLGQAVYQKTTLDSRFEIAPQDLNSGIYFFVVNHGDQIISNGKVMIE